MTSSTSLGLCRIRAGDPVTLTLMTFCQQFVQLGFPKFYAGNNLLFNSVALMLNSSSGYLDSMFFLCEFA
jgi:hypothetical protein